MKQILFILTVTLLIISCGDKEKELSTQEIIDTGNVDTIEAKKEALTTEVTALKTELSLIEEALKTINPPEKKEILVTTTTVKDTLFNHFVEIQGNVETKQNVIAVSYTHLRAHETRGNLVCRLLLEKLPKEIGPSFRCRTVLPSAKPDCRITPFLQQRTYFVHQVGFASPPVTEHGKAKFVSNAFEKGRQSHRVFILSLIHI